MGALEEERDGRILGECLTRKHLLTVWERQGWNLELVLALHL